MNAQGKCALLKKLGTVLVPQGAEIGKTEVQGPARQTVRPLLDQLKSCVEVCACHPIYAGKVKGGLRYRQVLGIKVTPHLKNEQKVLGV
jgi:hypothetical protein